MTELTLCNQCQLEGLIRRGHLCIDCLNRKYQEAQDLIVDALAYVRHDSDCSWGHTPSCDCGLYELGEKMLAFTEPQP